MGKGDNIFSVELFFILAERICNVWFVIVLNGIRDEWLVLPMEVDWSNFGHGKSDGILRKKNPLKWVFYLILILTMLSNQVLVFLNFLLLKKIFFSSKNSNDF
jgi:hypothetical protein